MTIRWITPLLGTGPASKVRHEKDVKLIDVRALVDKAGNQAGYLRQKITEGSEALRRGQKTVVCCDYGMSRSNAIAAGILALAESLSIAAAIRRVIAATGETEIKFEMIHTVAAALGEALGQEKPIAKKVLVTGATGDIGQHVLPVLQKSFPVKGIASADIDLRAGTQNFGLLCLEERPTHILHLAAPRVSSTNRGVGDEITMLKNVADVAATLKIKLIYLSSAQVFIGAENAAPLLADETYPRAPAGYMGHAKALGEQLLQDMKLDSCILRLGQVYGAGLKKPHFLTYFIDCLRQNLAVTTHAFVNGPPCVDLIHINDAAAALTFIIANNMSGLHHAGQGEIMHPKGIVEILKNELHSTSEIDSQEMEGHGNMVILSAKNFTSLVPLSVGLKDLITRSAMP